MRSHGLRYTFVTTEDIEHLAHKWTFTSDVLKLEELTGYFEVSILEALPAELANLLKESMNIRVTLRKDSDLGDLFFSDAWLGITIGSQHIQEHTPNPELQVLKFLELLVDRKLDFATGSTALIDVGGTKVFHQSDQQNAKLLEYISERYPTVAQFVTNAGLVELSADVSAATLHVRVVSKTPELLQISNSKGTLRSEVGIVQRQKRHLQDSEFKGLSTFLPSSDFDPFYIFFDQRLAPHSTFSSSCRTRLGNSGSHLSFQTSFQQIRDHFTSSVDRSCGLHAEFILPRQYFFDIFELRQLFGNDVKLFGEQDLEKPVWAVPGWGSVLYIELHNSSFSADDSLEVPFHARYLPPNSGGLPELTRLAAPQFFTACKEPDSAFADNPWDSAIMKRALFGDEHSFRVLGNNGAQNLSASAAVADSGATDHVVLITSMCMMLGFVYIVLQTWSRSVRKLSDTAINHMKDE